MSTLVEIKAIARQTGLQESQVRATQALLDDGNTVPFLARYRKEATGGLDEVQIRLIGEMLAKLRALDARRETVLTSITRQGKLTKELEAEINAAGSLMALEDLYQPYKPRRKTRASKAQARGLQGLAGMILQQKRTGANLARLAQPYLNADVQTLDEAWAGARDIVAQVISDHPAVRGAARQRALRYGRLVCQRKPAAVDERQVYEIYYQLDIPVSRLRPHQVLAINRGEAEKILRVHLEIPERDWRAAIRTTFRPDERSPLAGQLRLAIDDAAGRLLLPAIERDVRRILSEDAKAHAIQIFAANLRGLLLQPPQVEKTVLGIDPGFRSGCKLALVDPTGRLLDTATIYPHAPQNRWREAKRTLLGIIEREKVNLIAIGNGTASRPSEQLVAELIHERGEKNGKLAYLLVSEAGASVYSASRLAREELPQLDVSLRGAVSIARRAQDPLAELVKIDPKSIGVGMYQHDVDQKKLATALNQVVESVVNQVGVDVNTASPALLAHVAGIGPQLARKIVARREKVGAFKTRSELRKVAGLGAKAFQQAAGFIRIRDGGNPLDASAIHPESYAVAEKVLAIAGLEVGSSLGAKKDALDTLLAEISLPVLASRVDCGTGTLEDILEQLMRPGRDPRADLPKPILRTDVIQLEDLKTGMKLKGTVRNVVDFGAFVDIGVKQDGLLHRSQLIRGQRLAVGQVIEVTVLSVDLDRRRIRLGWLDTAG